MNRVKLSEVCEVRKGQSITKKKVVEGSIPVIAGGQQPAYYHNKSNRTGKTITISASGAYAGFVNYFEEPIFASDCSTIQSLDESKVLARYVFFLLKGQQKQIYKLQIGAGQPHVYPKDLAKLEIPLPPLPTQKRIVAILEKAESLKAKRAETNKETQKIIQAIFYDMFGFPKDNHRKLPLGIIGDLLIEVKYGTSKKADKEKGTYPILRMNNITYEGNLDVTNLKYVDLEESEFEKYGVKKGDILFNRTNSKELVGKTAVYNLNRSMVFAGYLVRGRTNNLSVPEYISAFLNSKYGKKVLQTKCKSIVGMANINAKEFQKIRILIPPIELQQEFAKKVQLIESIQSNQQFSTQEINTLFNALMQKAFKGD